MATIVKATGGWKAVIRKTGWPTASKTFRTRRDCEVWARRTEDEMVRGVYVDRTQCEGLTVAAALDRYLREVSPTKSAGSRRTEITHAAILKSRLGGYSLAALTPDIVAKYRDGRLRETSARWRRPISPSTVRLELAMLGHLFEIAIKEWRIGLISNPVRAIRKPSAHPGRNRRLTWSEMRRLLSECDRHGNPMLGWIVRIALTTAMRKSEITTLMVGQIDIARRVVRLHKTKNGTDRTVPLSRRGTMAFSAALGNPVRPDDCDLVFFGEPGKDGNRRPYCFEPMWQDAVRRAGIPDLRFHDLRHEAVSRFVELGLSDQEVSAISGHKSMQMLRRYTHLRAEDLVSRLDSARRA